MMGWYTGGRGQHIDMPPKACCITRVSNTHIQASVSPQGIAAADTPLLAAKQFGEPGPAAFLMGVDPQAQDAQVSFIPLDATGNAYAQGFGLYWNEGQRAYRLVVGGQAVPPPTVPDGSTLPRHTPLPSETQAPGEIEIVLYWVVGEELQPEYRRIPATQAVGTAALELLLAGPQQRGTFRWGQFTRRLPAVESGHRV